jgi:hypothetical protein
VLDANHFRAFYVVTPRQSQRANLEADLSRAQHASQGYLNGEVQNETTAFGQVGVGSHIHMKLSGQEARRPGGEENRKPRYLLRPVIQEQEKAAFSFSSECPVVVNARC